MGFDCGTYDDVCDALDSASSYVYFKGGGVRMPLTATAPMLEVVGG